MTKGTGMETKVNHTEGSFTLEVERGDLDELRVMLREQMAGDAEQLRWLRDNPEAGRRHGDHLAPSRLKRRLDLCWKLAERVGGVY